MKTNRCLTPLNTRGAISASSKRRHALNGRSERSVRHGGGHGRRGTGRRGSGQGKKRVVASWPPGITAARQQLTRRGTERTGQNLLKARKRSNRRGHTSRSPRTTLMLRGDTGRPLPKLPQKRWQRQTIGPASLVAAQLPHLPQQAGSKQLNAPLPTRVPRHRHRLRQDLRHHVHCASLKRIRLLRGVLWKLRLRRQHLQFFAQGFLWRSCSIQRSHFRRVWSQTRYLRASTLPVPCP